MAHRAVAARGVGGQVGIRWPRLPALRAGIAFYGLAAILAIFFFGPFIWTVLSSLKQPNEITTYPPVFIPAQLRWDNYARAWTKVPFLTFYINSFIVTTLAVTGQVVSATLVAYGFARF